MYPWLVTLHLLGFAVFMLAHGVSMWVAFRIRGERDRGVVLALLELSGNAARVLYIGLLLLGVGGLGAAASVGWLTVSWVVASYVVLAVVLVAMYGIASPYYTALRAEVAGRTGAEPLDGDALAARLRTRRPEALAAIGGTGLVVLIVLMTVKPG